MSFINKITKRNNIILVCGCVLLTFIVLVVIHGKASASWKEDEDGKRT